MIIYDSNPNVLIKTIILNMSVPPIPHPSNP